MLRQATAIRRYGAPPVDQSAKQIIRSVKKGLIAGRKPSGFRQEG